MTDVSNSKLSMLNASVELTSSQKVLKRKLVAWYHEHCGGRHVADER
jgi:hypothetical protein